MNIKNSFYLTLIGILNFCGIGRDDVPLSKYFDFAKDPVFDCIGELYYKNKFLLSCVLIDQKFILTAGHAFYLESGPRHIDSLYDPESQKWFFGNIPDKMVVGDVKDFTVKFSKKIYQLKTIIIHDRGKRGMTEFIRDSFGRHPTEDYNFDIAIAELESKVEKIIPAVLNDQNDELGKRAIMAGYGEVERSNEYNSENTLHKRRKMGGENMIDSVGGFKVGDNWAGLFFDFDGPNIVCCNRMGNSEPLPLEYYIDAGDCGGGLFINRYGKYFLAGLCAAPDYPSEYTRFGDKYGKYYGFTCYYLRVFAFKDWINSNIR